MNKKRVLLLITNLGKGGAQRVFYDHATAFSENCIVEESVFDREQDQRIYDSGLPLHDLKSRGFLTKLGPFGRLLSRAVILHRIVRRGNFEVVISHLDGANWVNVLSMSPAKKILVVHGSVFYDQGQSKVRRWFRINIISLLIYNRAAATVAVSEGVSHELTEICNVKRVYTINNFFENKNIKSSASLPLGNVEDAIFRNPNVLITSGRLTIGKRQALLLKIVSELRRKNVSVRLVLLGDGEMRQELLDESSRLGLSTYQVWNIDQEIDAGFDVYFLGYVDNPFKYLSKATLFLFPSAWEGFPLALCEAMISGVPVLSSDCPTGPREILAPGTTRRSYDLREAELVRNGVLLPMLESLDDLAVWTGAVEKLLGDSTLRNQLAERGAEAMQALDRSVVVFQWYELIESVCDTARVRRSVISGSQKSAD